MIMINNNERKLTLLKELCDYCDYKLNIVAETNEIILSRYGEADITYKNIDIALCDFYQTMIEVNKNHDYYTDVNRYTCWTIEDMDLVRGIITQNALKLVKSRIESEEGFNHIYKDEAFVLDFFVGIFSECQEEVISSNLEDWCTNLINENIDFLNYDADNIGEEVIEKIEDENKLILTYAAMIKDYREELIALGKLAKSWMEEREFYEYVVWEDFSDETYMDMGYKIYKEKGILEELIELEESEDGYLSNRAFDLLIDVVDLGVEREGYEFNDEDRFIKSCIGKVKEKCFSCKKEVSLEDRYDLQKCPNCGEEVLPQDSQSKIVVKEIYDVDAVNQIDEEGYDFQMYFDFENGDAINNYFIDWILGYHFIGCLVDKKDGVFDLDNCRINMVWHGDNSEKFPFTDEQIRTIKDKVIKEIKDNNMGEIKDSENKIEEELVNGMNTLQVKYDIDLQYKGTEFVGVLECHKIECKGIPCVKDDKLELVNALYSQKGCENYIIKFIEINNVVYSISDMKYWYGINTDELFEQIDYLIREQETPKEYIKTSYKTYKIENFDDVLEADLEGCIEEFFIEDEVLSNVVQKYMGCDVEFLVSDLNTLLEDINNDMDALESVLGENPKLSYWLNSEVYCYPNCNLDEAYERYLEEEEEIPFKAIDYIDINTFIKNETDLRELELNNCTILYC